MNWLYYLLEANLYLVLFYGFYRFFLQNETFYNLNRYFLLLSTIISFVLPVLQIGFLKPSYEHINGELVFIGEIPPPPMEPPSAENLSNPFADINWFYVFYLLIAFGFALKLSFSIYKIINIWVKAKKHSAGEITLIEVNDESTAFSFFNLLFIHPALADQPTVLKHEMVHIKQKHSFDVVFFELVQIICWFNPILPFIKKDIKLLHEYIADDLTATADVQKHEYALFLIQNSFGLRVQPITNQIFNQSILKRRINMLNKKRTAGWARLRLLLAVPLTGSMLCMSTMAFTKDYVYLDLLPEKSTSVAPIQDKPKGKTSEKKEIMRAPLPLKYFIPLSNTGKDKVVYSIEKRYILINGKKVDNLNTFYGAANADKIIKLDGAQAIKKYGSAAKFGAVEIIGKNIYLLKSAAEGPPPPTSDVVRFPPPKVKRDQVKFPPTFKPKVQTYFTPNIKTDIEGKNRVGIDKRYIVVNGTPIVDNSKFLGVTKTESVTYLNTEEAIKVYGAEKGKYGAVEITGKDIYFNTQDDQIRFPPPIVKPDQTVKRSETPPPPVEAPPPPKVEVVKFPPPVVKQDAPKFKTKGSQTPPPPVEPPAPKFRTKKAASPPPPVEPPPPKFRTKKSTAVKTPPPPVDPATKPLTKN